MWTHRNLCISNPGFWVLWILSLLSSTVIWLFPRLLVHVDEPVWVGQKLRLAANLSDKHRKMMKRLMESSQAIVFRLIKMVQEESRVNSVWTFSSMRAVVLRGVGAASYPKLFIILKTSATDRLYHQSVSSDCIPSNCPHNIWFSQKLQVTSHKCV